MIVEFQVDASFPHQTATSLSTGAIRLRQLQYTNGRCQAVVWFSAPERSSIDAALRGDDSVASFTHVSTTDRGHAYSVDTGDRTLATLAQGLLNANSVLEGGEWVDGHWDVRAQFPDKGTVLAFRDELVDSGVDIDIQSFTEDADREVHYGVTDPQREVLLLALDNGYFTVPREASLSDLASELGISSQAASERLRRGTRTLVASTLGATEEPRIESRSS